MLFRETETRLVQDENASAPIEMMELPRMTKLRDVQQLNASLSMNCTESGMITPMRLEQFEKAFEPMEVTRP